MASRVAYVSKSGERIVGCGLGAETKEEAAYIVAKFAPFAAKVGGRFEVVDDIKAVDLDIKSPLS